MRSPIARWQARPRPFSCGCSRARCRSLAEPSANNFQFPISNFMSTLWSGRFASAPDHDVFAFGASFAFDRRLFEDDVEGSRAWSEALLRAGVLSPDEQQALDRALTELRDAAAADPSFVSGADEDVHSFVE